VTARCFSAPFFLGHQQNVRPKAIDPILSVVNNNQGMAFCRSPPLWAMACLGGLDAIAHGVGSHKGNNICMVDTNMGHSNFTGLDQKPLQLPYKPRLFDTNLSQSRTKVKAASSKQVVGKNLL
jgi:hypothetical protein